MLESPNDPASVWRDPRVQFAAERTLLAWVRTGIALMGFGFVVARFGLFLREVQVADVGGGPPRPPGWSLWIGVALVALGVSVNFLTAVAYHRALRAAPTAGKLVPQTWRLAVVVTALLGCFGIALAVSLLLTGLR